MFKGGRRDREASAKRKVLRALIDAEGEKCTNAIIFCNRKTDVDICAKSLKKYGYDAAAIHGDLDQSQRMKTLDGFRDGSLRLLVASDVAARGLDVPSVSHVFNFDVPGHPEDYVHRIGRTGRAGRDGKAITICSGRDEKALAAIEKLIQKDIPKLDNPVKDEPKADTQKPEKKTKSADTQKSEGKKSDRKKDKEPKGRGRRSDNGNAVVGMGDHLPSFSALSFAERRAG